MKETLSSIDGVSLFPIIAIVLFMVIFGLIVLYALRMDKTRVNEMAAMPLAEDEPLIYRQVSPNGKSKK
jgi:cbb3-type cytochrome oxidase subunit 3